MQKYIISNKQRKYSILFYTIILFLGIIVAVLIYGFNVKSLLYGIVFMIVALLFTSFVITQLHCFLALGFDKESVYVWKRVFFRIKRKQYPIVLSNFKYKKNYYGSLGKPYCFLIEGKYDRKETIPEPMVGADLLQQFMKDMEISGIYIERNSAGSVR